MIIEINPYDRKSILKASKEVQKYKTKLKEMESVLLQRLTEIGATKVQLTYSTYSYSTDLKKEQPISANHIEVTFNVDGTMATIVASGDEIAFIEFGAGVYFNRDNPYPKPRPAGIVGIGQYGKGYGKRDAWNYNKDGEHHVTRGNPPAKAFWEAELIIKERFGEIAREVFKL